MSTAACPKFPSSIVKPVLSSDHHFLGKEVIFILWWFESDFHFNDLFDFDHDVVCCVVFFYRLLVVGFGLN
jgi:hypothetical protein